MNTLGINLRQRETEMVRAVIFELSISFIILTLLFWATYWVIKSGVRDGIKEATPWHQGAATPTRQAAPEGYKWTLVKETAHTEDMRAD